ncbi:MAG: dihydroneopterin aldolase [Betaproteobacteria bacterium]|nr:dihydroneopterin aldolase [Betaproteobacteria bacterium]
MSSLLLHPQLSDCRRIFIEDLEFQASIGFHEFERQARQRVKISVSLFVPVEASRSGRDDVDDTLDYDKLREGIAALAASRHFNLQETLIDEVLSFCLKLGPVRAATVRTEKPDVYPDCNTVGIESIRFAAT